MSVACACADGNMGAQVCGADGIYGECDCTGCVPGSSALCACSDGSPGSQVCNADGLYEACDCTTPGGCVPGETQICACSDGAAGVQSCTEDQVFGACECECPLCDLQAGMVGIWEGTVNTPWTSPYSVHVEFHADGHYSAYCKESDCTAFYYGTDDDAAEKQYHIADILGDGTGAGTIVIYFFPGSTNVGELRKVELGGHGRLTFEFWHRGEYGPLEYDLSRIGDIP